MEELPSIIPEELPSIMPEELPSIMEDELLGGMEEDEDDESLPHEHAENKDTASMQQIAEAAIFFDNI